MPIVKAVRLGADDRATVSEDCMNKPETCGQGLDGTTFVSVSESGFSGSGDELVKYVADSTQGFTLMLGGLKAFLEHGVKLNLTADRYPEGIDEQELIPE